MVIFCMYSRESLFLIIAGIDSYDIDVSSERVVVRSSLASEQVKSIIESTGKLAVLIGTGVNTGQRSSAVAMLGVEGNFLSPGARGVVRLSQVSGEECVVEGVVDGLSPGLHGLAVHETGDTSEGCASLGGHYNPRGVRHGSPEQGEQERHAGDLGNIMADQQGRASFRLVDRVLKVWDIIGRSVVVSSHEDDLGLGKGARSHVDGNCGPGAVCGVIARAAGVGQNYKKICACDGVSIWDERNKPMAGDSRSSQS